MYLKKCLNFQKGYTQKYDFCFKGITFWMTRSYKIYNNAISIIYVYSFACDFFFIWNDTTKEK